MYQSVSTATRRLAVAVVALSAAAAVSAGPAATPANATTPPVGSVVTGWGYELGQVSAPPGLTGVTAVDGGTGHSLALRTDGTVVGWGYGGDGQATVPPGLAGVTAIAAGDYHSLARRSDGTVVAWGYGGDGRATVPPGLTGVTAVAAGGSHSLALRSDGTVVGWGLGAQGQTTAPPAATGVTAIAAGGFHSLALRSDGTVVAWGSDAEGVSTVPPGLTDVVAIAAGWSHNVALRSDGTVVAWGSDAEGASAVPSGLTGVTAIAAGEFHSLVLTAPVSITAPAAVTGVEATGTGGAVVADGVLGTATGSGGAGALTVTVAGVPAAHRFPLGTTTLTWTADDGHGHDATGTQAVTVVDTTAPALTVPANATAVALSDDGAPVTYAAPTASDLADGAVTAGCDRASGTTFPIGVTTVTCTATDAAGNTGTATFPVTVAYADAPPGITHTVTSAAASHGGWYRRPVTVTFTCTRAALPGGGLGAAITECPAPRTLTADGTTTVAGTVRATDGSTATDTVLVRLDRTAPTLGISGVRPGWRYLLARVPTARCTTVDRTSGLARWCTVTVRRPATGVGRTTYTTTVADRAGNTTTRTGAFTVVYGGRGFTGTLAGAHPRARAGTQVTVALTITDGNGRLVAGPAPGWLGVQRGPVLGRHASDRSFPRVTARGGTAFYRDRTGQWHLRVFVDRTMAGRYWRFAVALPDGTVRTAIVAVR